MRIFVYGTLTDPDRVAAVLGNRPAAQYTLVGSAVLDGLHRVDGEYPTLAPGGHVEGQLLGVNETGLDQLDRYESVDTGPYTRVSVPIDDSSETAAVYVGDPTRLGVADAVDWPPDDAFADGVRTYVTRHEICVRRTE